MTLQILPPPAEEFFRYAADSNYFARRQEKPDPNGYFPPAVKALAGAGQILVFGTGTGKSSEMDRFVAWPRCTPPISPLASPAR